MTVDKRTVTPPEGQVLVWKQGTVTSTDDDGGPMEGIPHDLSAWFAGPYKIIRQRGKDGLFILSGKRDGMGLGVPTLKAAKLAAQVDHDAALTPPPAAPTDNTALVDVLASLAAAISLLERGGKKAAPSDKMFEQMLIDYRASLERGRTAALASREAPPAAPTDNTALAEAARQVVEWFDTVAPHQRGPRIERLRAALASREAPPACPQEAVTEITKAKEVLSRIGAYAGGMDYSRIVTAVGHIDAALRALKGERG